MNEPLPSIRTERLLLRRWRESDREPFAALCADPAVMEHFPACLTRAESDAVIDRIESVFDRYGLGFFAVQEKGGPFVGFVGLSVPGYETPFTPCVEIGWRLAREHQGQGYAQEAARAALAFGFEVKGLGEIVSFTSTTNLDSARVMERIGMTRDPDGDFDHPALADGHRLQRHVLYRLGREDWRRARERASGLRLRRAGPGDEDAFRTVRLASLAMDPGAFESGLERERDLAPEAWRQRLEQEAVFLLDSDFGPRGLVRGAVDPEDPAWRFLLGLWVEPELRGSGAAQSLVAALRDRAQAEGATGLRLHVHRDNERALGLYRRFGFEVVGEAELPDSGGRVELDLRLVFPEARRDA